MAHMEPDIEFGEWFEIDSTLGAEFILADLAKDAPQMDLDQWHEVEDSPTLQQFLASLEDYVTVPLDYIDRVRRVEGWGARMSAPGYLDCTDWVVFSTFEEAEEYLEETYNL